MFARIVTGAVFAGFAAGSIAALLQLYFVQPVLLHAELYEGGDLIHFGADAVDASRTDPGGIDITRDGLSLLFTVLIYTGFGLILTSAMALASDRGAVVDARSGLIWGAAGWAAVHFAPAFGLPPALPGLAAAEVAERQIWWAGTVIATAVALALVAFGRGWSAWGAALAMLLAPHLVGAPEPEVFTGPAPPELGAKFAARALGVGLVAWIALGGFAGYFWQRAGADATQTA